MPVRAKVKSLEEIEAFRSSLVTYVSQARAALEEISSEVIRTRVWIEDDQRTNWEHELRRRGRALEEAQAALFSARLSTFTANGISLEQIAVQRARRAVEEANVKLRVLKKWARDFESVVQPQLKQVEKLHTVLSHDMAKGLAELSQIITVLAAYAEQGKPAPAAQPSTGPTGPETPSA
jgi:uncharacterized protein YpbB